MGRQTGALRAGVIGAGHIATQHLACLRELAGARVVGVADLSPAIAQSTAERFGVERWYTDHRRMLDECELDVVHVTTPPQSHFKLAMDVLDANAHVIVEKPATVHFPELETLLEVAERKNRCVLEDYNYIFNGTVQQILALLTSGEFGEVTHVEVMLCLNILGRGSAFLDPNVPHPTRSMRGGAIADFITHLAALAYVFIGPHRAVNTIWNKRSPSHSLPADEFRGMIDAERGTGWVGFSAHAQPDLFCVRVYGTKMRATANLFEPRLTVERIHNGPRPMTPLLNGLHESGDAFSGAVNGVIRKFSGGPGSYEGIWELLSRTYAAFGTGAEPPITAEHVRDVNRLVADLKGEEVGV
jgi:predicted dehydrogenase